MQDALTCKDRKCIIHNEQIHQLHKQIIEVCNKASNACLPHTTGKNSRKVVPGWNEYVKEHA